MNVRTDTADGAAGRPMTEGLATVALLLNVASIVGFALCLGAVGYAETGVAISAGIVAACSFVASLVCFAADSAPPPSPAGGLELEADPYLTIS